MIGSLCLKLVDNMFGLVAQPGRAPGFYSARVAPARGASSITAGLKNEKRPDGRGFKSPRARFVWEVNA